MNAAIQEVTLDKMKLVIIAPIEERLASIFAEPAQCVISAHQAFAADEFVLRVTQEVLGHIMERQEVRYPANWWEAVKQRFAPEWFKERWPVRETVIELVARELYPYAAMPDQNPLIGIELYKRLREENSGIIK
jgi:hypothetical protein